MVGRYFSRLIATPPRSTIHQRNLFHIARGILHVLGKLPTRSTESINEIIARWVRRLADQPGRMAISSPVTPLQTRAQLAWPPRPALRASPPDVSGHDENQSMSDGADDGIEPWERVKFRGTDVSISTRTKARIKQLLDSFDDARPLTSIAEAIELHNASKHVEVGALDSESNASDRESAANAARRINAAVARLFNSLRSDNLATVILDTDFYDHDDLVTLLSKFTITERCDAATFLDAIEGIGMHLESVLESKRLVVAYGDELRARILSSPLNAELLIRSRLQRDRQQQITLPAALSSSDCYDLLLAYIDHPDANLNCLRLVETAHTNRQFGIDRNLKLKAKRRAEELTHAVLSSGVGIRNQYSVGIADDLTVPSTEELLHRDDDAGTELRYTYSAKWLEETLDFPSILNNFQHLFGFADTDVMLAFPAYRTRVGAIESLFSPGGTSDYQTGVAFNTIDTSSLMQTQMYSRFLASRDIDLEVVFAWFFTTYLPEEYGAEGFRFNTSEPSASSLLRVRNLFSEMEGVLHQFTEFVETGIIDHDLLEMGPDAIRYKNLPSLLPSKYMYPASDELRQLMNSLFSTHHGLGYINQRARERTLAKLLLRDDVGYNDFHEYQRDSIDMLVEAGLFTPTDDRLVLVDAPALALLAKLYDTGSISYHRVSPSCKEVADKWVEAGWLKTYDTLLTAAEASYFNYFLNEAEFGNGPKLRNKYAHGSRTAAPDDSSHASAYLVALRLMISLIIKINEEFVLRAQLRNS